MLWKPLVFVFLPLLAHASVGDNLPLFQRCVSECESAVCLAKSSPKKFTENSVNPISGFVFGWDCLLDCRYKCQQLVTADRIQHGEQVVQFFGKWPFTRVFGVTELFSTLFSMGNFYVNYSNLAKLRKNMRINANNPEKMIVFRQSILLVLVNMFGWTCSSIFHIRDTPLTEIMDYLGAGAIVMANFNAICIRYFDLHLSKNKSRRQMFQYGLMFVLCIHYTRLYISWDYDYNMAFNVVIGLAAAALWIAHSLNVYRKCSNGNVATKSIYVAPYEAAIARKLEFIGIKGFFWIPLIPVVLNVFLILSVSLELVDFVPWFLLIDAHSLWHLCTMIPPSIWHDWNLWELELASVGYGLS